MLVFGSDRRCPSRGAHAATGVYRERGGDGNGSPVRPTRKIGVLLNYLSGDLDGQARIRAFAAAMRNLGWIEGENLQTEIRFAGDEADRYRTCAKELVEAAPDLIVAAATPSVAALQSLTHNVPVVFVAVIDPVGAGFTKSLARPGGNMTGFTVFEYSISGKWLELLKELAPGVKRVAVVRDPSFAAAIGQFSVIQSLASSTSEMELTAIDPRDPELERGLAEVAGEAGGGVIITASSASNVPPATALVVTTISSANSLSVPILPGRWRSCRLWAEYCRHLRARCRLR